MPVANLASKYQVGTQAVDKVYAGNNLIWSAWPTGIIVHHAGNTAPQGWAKCDGSAHGSPALQTLLGSANTPNLTDMFVRTAAGGANTATLAAANLPAHNHSMGTDSATHTHSGTSGAMSANATHTHAAAPNWNDTQHYHAIPAANTGTMSAWHTHTSLIFNEGDGGDGDGSWVDQSPNNDGYVKDVGDTGNPSANHSHTVPATTTSGIDANHTHTFTSSYFEPTHAHAFNATGTGTHTHTVAAEGGGAAVSVVPAHYALIYIIRL